MEMKLSEKQYENKIGEDRFEIVLQREKVDTERHDRQGDDTEKRPVIEGDDCQKKEGKIMITVEFDDNIGTQEIERCDKKEGEEYGLCQRRRAPVVRKRLGEKM